MYDALRKKVKLYENYTDAQIDLSMVMMGPDYRSYLSTTETHGPVGVLVLAHGYREKGDEMFTKEVEPISGHYPTAIAFGMSMVSSSHIQQAVDDLVAAGAEKIVVIPALSSSFNTQMRQWESMFGIHEDPGYLQATLIETKAQVIYAPPLENHPIVARIIGDYAKEKSVNPANEVVIVVSHGPEEKADNDKTLALLESLAMKVKEVDGFSDAKWASLQNDAPREIRAANVEQLKGWVAEANAQGKDVIIVTNLIAPRTIQSEINKDLAGLNYKFDARGLTQHPLFEEWLRSTVAEAIAP